MHKNFADLNDCYLAFNNSDNNHPISVKINPVPIKGEGLKTVTISSNGIEIKPVEIGSIGRGVKITLSFASEQGDNWDLEFQFHKGITTVNSKLIEKQIETIWRD